MLPPFIYTQTMGTLIIYVMRLSPPMAAVVRLELILFIKCADICPSVFFLFHVGFEWKSPLSFKFVSPYHFKKACELLALKVNNM